MNIKSPYFRIAEFCQKEKKDKIIERILYHKYVEELTELIDSYKKDNSDNEPPSETIDGYTSTLLSDTNLSKNIRLAEEELEEALNDKISEIKKKIERTNFWKSVFASVVGSFIFILLLIAIFIVAENQVKSLFNFNNQNTNSIEKLQPKEMPK